MNRIKRSVSETNSYKSSKSNFVTKQPSIGGKDLHQSGLKHTTPLINVRSLIIFLQQHPKMDPLGPSEDNLHRSNSSSIIKNPCHFYLIKSLNIKQMPNQDFVHKILVNSI
jgi:hypothetical protein